MSLALCQTGPLAAAWQHDCDALLLLSVQLCMWRLSIEGSEVPRWLVWQQLICVKLVVSCHMSCA